LSPVQTSTTFQFAAFMTKLNATGTAVIFSNQLSGGTRRTDVIDAVAVDSLGAAYGVGFSSDPTTFTLLNPIQGYPLAPQLQGLDDAVALRVDSSGVLQWSTFLGIGAVPTLARVESASVAVDSTGNAYLLLSVDGLTGTPGSLNPQQPAFPSYMLFKIAPSLGAPVPIIFPGSVTYPATLAGTSSAPSAVRIGNYGDAALSAPVISITGPFSETNNCSTGVPAGQKCDIAVVFSPIASGSQTGSLNLNFGPQLPAQSVQLSGVGTSPGVSLSATSLSFPSQAVNIASAAQAVVIKNTGTAPLSISLLQITGDFSQTNNCGPAIATGSSCTVQVVFTPTALGSRTGTLTITDNAPGSPHTISLNGTGAAPGLGLRIAGTAPATASVVAGGTASFALSIGGQGVNGTATLSCSGAPAAATCSLPGSITINSTTATNFTVTIATAGRSAALIHAPGIGKSGTLWMIGLVAMVLPLVKQVRKPKTRSFLLLPFVFAGLFLLCSCGGGASGGGTSVSAVPQGTPAGTYVLSVAASSGTTTESTVVTLTVQ
jgi:hypothetical protein